jgi:hypothetical protein
MKTYKVKQEIFNKMNRTDDLLENIEHRVEPMDSKQIIDYVSSYFSHQMDTVFPGKSYAVAIVYAKLISKYFNEDFFEVLNDPDLFIGTDKYFTPYGDNQGVYDEIIKKLTQDNLMAFENNSLPQVMKTVKYFREEFLWEE